MYLWFVAVHLPGLFLFAAAHGVSMWASFRLRSTRGRPSIAMLLAVSQRSLLVADVGLIVLGIGGLAAAATAGWLTTPWVIGSYLVVIALFVAMSALGSSLYYPLRDEVIAGKPDKKSGELMTDEELHRRLDNRRPEALALTGAIGIALLVWLMVFKPGS